MATARRQPSITSVWRGRTLEWAVMVVVLLVAIGFMRQQSRALQVQAEVAAVQSTLGSLRTALVIAHLQKVVQAEQGVVVDLQQNPFKILRAVPSNYAGEVARSDIASVVAGSWVFDKECACIGYVPMSPESLEPKAEPAVLWYRVSGAPGPLQITATESYLWQGQPVN
jgi:uncharacterized membrane protein